MTVMGLCLVYIILGTAITIGFAWDVVTRSDCWLEQFKIITVLSLVLPIVVLLVVILLPIPRFRNWITRVVYEKENEKEN